MSTNQYSPAFEQAIELFQAGKNIEAENVLISAVKAATNFHGQGSQVYAQANYELSSLQAAMGRKRDAIEAMKIACSIKIPDDHNATKNRLTYLMQLGELCEDVGDLAEAEGILRECLTLREAFYGEEHSGYGFGLEPLASVLSEQGRYTEAIELIDMAIDIFWKDGHPRVATAFPTRALILARMDEDEPSFTGLQDVPDETMLEMLQNVTHGVDYDDPVPHQKVCDEMLREMTPRFGPQHESIVQLQTVLANIGRMVGPSEGRLETIEKVIEAHRSNGNHRQMVIAMLGLAMAHDELSDAAQAESVYRMAFRQAKQLEDDGLQSQCLRNLGLFYSERNQKELAEKTLRMSARLGKKSGDREMFGRTLTALGVFLQHESRIEEAQKLLQNGLSFLDPTHPDSVCARSHLNAIQSGESCGCGDMSVAICEALRQFILASVPEGILQDVNVAMDDDGFRVGVETARDLDEGEMNSLGRTIQQCEIQFRERLKEQN